MNLQLIQKNNETILPICFYGQNRNKDVLEYHKKVFKFYNIPINYIEWPFHMAGHGDAIQHLINQTVNLNIDYYLFVDMDAIPTRKDCLDIIYSKICDHRTIFGPAWTSNHKSPTHIHASPCFLAFSKDLYVKLGCPQMHDRINRSDNGEELSWAAAENGYNICLVYPKAFNELTDEECKETGAPKYWNLGGKFKYGLGTEYSDIIFHTGLAGVKRSSQVFIDKCKEILNENNQNYLESVITCVNYGDILELTLPKNKKHFDNLMVITDSQDAKTKRVCDRNGVKCIQTDIFYNKGTIFNKGAAINLGYENLKYKDWCINLDADIILPDNFSHAFFAHKLDKNELYGCPRKFIWNYEQYSKWEKNQDIDEELLTLDGAGVGYFQAFNFNSDKIKNIPINQLYQDSMTAEQVDINFLYRFYPPPNPQVPRLNIEVLHLGPPGLFNNRKTNSKLVSIKHLQFKDFPNLSDNEIFKDYPDIYEHRNKPEQKYNKHYKFFKNTIKHRDFVFKMCLEEFKNKLINILEIGTSRAEYGKECDGWSTFFWCEHIKKYGGKLTICEIDPQAILLCKELISDYIGKIDIEFICDDGLNCINDNFNLIFLDGADDPQQMLEQFEKIDRTKTKILCDDFHVKGKIVREKYKDFQLIKVNEIHEMAIYESK